ncbi:MAG: hypothetical protein ACLRWQ_03510 [Flavonifractor plautii]
MQVPSAGQPIIMLADRQTTGGYGLEDRHSVIPADFPLSVAQLKAGDKVRFVRRVRGVCPVHTAGPAGGPESAGRLSISHRRSGGISSF